MSSRISIALVLFGAFMAGCSSRSQPAPEVQTPTSGPSEEVLIPYGSQDSQDVTGAVSSVPMDETEHIHDVVELLRSHVPGLQVTYAPNGDVRLRIRGGQQSMRLDEEANQPLLVIDGMPVLPTQIMGALRAIVPHQVESIQVLKDVSSTAIYGNRGANGVILIRMKR